MSEKQKKIGILTFHCSNNYGAVLQAYALRKTLSDLYESSDVHVINYRCEGTVSKTSFKDLRIKKGLAGAILHYRQINSINRKFEDFRKEYLQLTTPYKDKNTLKKDIADYDMVISGSDQVWNLKWSDGDEVYFQDFNDSNNKFSYAASFGFNTLEDSLQPLYKKHLKEFNKISVREDSGKDIIEKQLGLKAEKHVDPTLLLSREEWSSIAKKPNIKGKYILVYMVPKQDSVIEYAVELSKKTKLPIVMLSKNLKPLNAIHAGDSSPEEFVGWFENAEYVVTNSFHGTAFSIIFGKKLCIELNNLRGLNIRSKNLLELCGLNINNTEDILCFENMDWKIVEKNLSYERKNALDYLSGLSIVRSE